MSRLEKRAFWKRALDVMPLWLPPLVIFTGVVLGFWYRASVTFDPRVQAAASLAIPALFTWLTSRLVRSGDDRRRLKYVPAMSAITLLGCVVSPWAPTLRVLAVAVWFALVFACIARKTRVALWCVALSGVLTACNSVATTLSAPRAALLLSSRGDDQRLAALQRIRSAHRAAQHDG